MIGAEDNPQRTQHCFDLILMLLLDQVRFQALGVDESLRLRIASKLDFSRVTITKYMKFYHAKNRILFTPNVTTDDTVLQAKRQQFGLQVLDLQAKHKKRLHCSLRTVVHYSFLLLSC